MKKRKIKLLILGLIIVQTIIYIGCGMAKSYIHMDEAYSYGLANYNKTEIQNNEDFYNQWHEGKYYEDYLSVNENEKDNFSPVYENQKNDVHPPLYYLLLRISMNFSIGKYSKWPGLILNIIISIFITLFTYCILKRILKKEKNFETKAALLAFISSIMLSSLTNVIYIRMYALLTLFILMVLLLHLKLLEHQNSKLIMFLIGVISLLGSLTHYYFLFFLFIIYLLFLIKYLKEKDYKSLVWYTGSLGFAAIISLLIFPYSIQHMFFGYRGEGFIHNLFNISKMTQNIFGYLYKVQFYTFNQFLLCIVFLVMGLMLLKKNTKPILEREEKEILKLIIIPSTFYFLIVSIASPYIELRYILPICNLIFITIIYIFYKYLKSIFEEKTNLIILGICFLIMLSLPFILKMEPETMYSNRKEVVEKVNTLQGVPAIYFYKSEHNRFLDDILLFTKFQNSYIAKDLDYTAENLYNIVKEQDVSKGIILIFNEGQDNDTIIDLMKKTIDLANTDYLSHLNAADIYYIY